MQSVNGTQFLNTTSLFLLSVYLVAAPVPSPVTVIVLFTSIYAVYTLCYTFHESHHLLQPSFCSIFRYLIWCIVKNYCLIISLLVHQQFPAFVLEVYIYIYIYIGNTLSHPIFSVSLSALSLKYFVVNLLTLL